MLNCIKNPIFLQNANSIVGAFSGFQITLMTSNQLSSSSCRKSQLNYYSLLWIFHGKAGNKELSHPHKRTLQILHNDYFSSSGNLCLACFVKGGSGAQITLHKIVRTFRGSAPLYQTHARLDKFLTMHLLKERLKISCYQ